MGAIESAPADVRPARPQRSLANQTLQQLGIVEILDDRVLREHGWQNSVGAPLYIAHRELGQCQLIAMRDHGLAAEERIYAVRRMDPLYEPGRSAPVAGKLYAVPKRHVEQLPLAICEFRPFGLQQQGSSTMMQAEFGTVGSEDGFVRLLSNHATVYHVPWKAFQRAMTIRAGTDPHLARKIELIGVACLRRIEDIQNLQRAARLLERCYQETCCFMNVHLADGDAWAPEDLRREPQRQQLSIVASGK